ncbi:MAG: DUF3488 and transglutaminase-like domain-containing protein [Acidimicrobiales bacterium]
MSILAPPRPPPAPSPPPPPAAAPEPAWRERMPWRSADARAAPGDDLATFCAFLVTLAVAVSLGRLFRGSAWLPYGVAAAGLGHLLAWALRRLGAGLTATSVASPLLSLLVTIELVVPQATTYGIPTPFTFQVLGQALTDAQSAFRTAVPPVAPSTGFLAAAIVGICMCAFLADWAAFRMRTAFEACAPGLALFVFAAVLGAKSHRALAVATFAAAALVFLIVQRANLDGASTAWFGGRDRGALPSLLVTGAVLGSVAVLGALVLGPKMPGATSKPLLSFKKGAGGSGPGSRSTVSPLVDIQTRRREYADVEVFTVKAGIPAYWRLTSLDQFNGTIWSSNERYAASRGQLGPGADATKSLVQEVTVTGLSSIWLPAAYRPTAVDGIGGLSYSPGSASLISKKDTSNGLTYRITSEVAPLGPEALRRAPPSAPGRSGLGDDLRRYTEVSGPVSPRVRQLAARLAGGEATPYAKALAIQEHLRSDRFTYSLNAPAGHSGNAVDRFLFETRTGYCEQFAGSYALLARLAGLPTRVAVGFQPGAFRDGTFEVRDKDAHAWPEVYLEGIGWTAFEPTPSAGNPQAESYTGVPYIPAAPAEPEPASPAPDSSTTVPAPEAPGTEPEPGADEPDPDQPDEPGKAGGLTGFASALRRFAPLLAGLSLIAIVVGGSGALVAWDRSSRRRRAGGSTEARVHMAWQESMDALALTGNAPRRSETVAELLHRLSLPGGVDPETKQALNRLGGAVVQTAYTERGHSQSLADQAEADRDTVIRASRASIGLRSRLRADLDPRPALARLRS